MSTRDTTPVGAPCWTDLWTSDVEGSRKFYSEVFGWEAQEPNQEFGGYFMFTRDGVPIAGGMGPMNDQPPSNSWSVYLGTDDVAKAVEIAEAEGAQIISPVMAVADIGTQAILTDPTGVHVGLWQPGTFQGFTVLNEPGTPSWFQLDTRDHAKAVAFYETVVRWDTHPLGEGDITYILVRPEGSEDDVAGVVDASGFLPEGVPGSWSVYWQTDDVDATIAKVIEHGGSVVREPEDTPYGRLATVADPAGAQFKLRGETD